MLQTKQHSQAAHCSHHDSASRRPKAAAGRSARSAHLSGAAAGESADYPTHDDDEKLVVALADAMTRDIVVPDAIMQRLARALRRPRALETVATVAAYDMVSRLLVALNVEH